MNFQKKHISQYKIALKRVLIILSFVFFSFPIKAQLWIEEEAIYNEAEEYLHGEEYVEALPLYTLLEKKGISNAHINYKIGKCYLHLAGRKSRAIPFLEAAVEHTKAEVTDSLSETYAPYEAFILLGEAYRIDNQFVNAIKSFESYKKLELGKEAEILMDYEIKKCETGYLMMQNPTNSKIEKLEDNSIYPLYNPVVSESGTIKYMEKRPFYDAIISGKIEGGKTANIENLTPRLKSDGDHVLVSSTDNGNLLILIAYDPGFGYEIYTATIKGDGSWGKIKKLPEPINSVYNETFAYITKDGNELYFCSNRKGGQGGLDIYKSTLNDNGQWTEPENLGNRINSTLNETSVYISKDESKLFFASEGHVNMGGADFFVSSKGVDGKWTMPVNIGSPVSTTDDDDFLSPALIENSFFTYRFDQEESDKSKIYQVYLSNDAFKPKVLIRGQLNFSDTLPGQEVPFNVKDIQKDIVLSESKTDSDGKYSFFVPTGDYIITYEYSDKISAEQEISIKEEPTIDELTIQSPQWVLVKSSMGEVRILTIRDILFGFNNYKLLDKYYSMLDSVFFELEKDANLEIIITGYSDSKGKSKYNLMLSEQRAKTVAKYFLKKGLPENRITIKARGEMEPVAINANPDGKDSPEGRLFNRRVTIEIPNTNQEIMVRKVNLVPKELRVKAAITN